MEDNKDLKNTEDQVEDKKNKKDKKKRKPLPAWASRIILVLVIFAVLGGFMAYPYFTGDRVVPKEEFTPEAKEAIAEVPKTIENMLKEWYVADSDYDFRQKLSEKMYSITRGPNDISTGRDVDGLEMSYDFSELIDDGNESGEGVGWADKISMRGYWFQNEDYAKNFFTDECEATYNPTHQNHEGYKSYVFAIPGYSTFYTTLQGSFVFQSTLPKNKEYIPVYREWIKNHFGFEWEGDFT